MEDIYVKRLVEKIYSAREKGRQGLDESELRFFFDELVSRKRDDPFEGGLQAAIVILSDCFAAKVAENNGSGLHSCTNINLIKYLKKDHKYYSDKAMRFPSIYSKQTKILSEEGVDVRILDGSEELVVTIFSFNDINDYQRDIMKKIVTACYDVISNYGKVEIAIYVPNISVECVTLDDDSYKNIISVIDRGKSKGKR